MKCLEINAHDFWKQVFYNSENMFQLVKIENSNFQQEVAVKIKQRMHVEHCDTIFMEDELITLHISKKLIKEILPQHTVTILEDISDIALAITEIEKYNKKNHIINLRKKYFFNKK